MPSIPRNNRRPWQPERIQFEKVVDNKFYHSTAWRKFRKIFLQKNPICVMCEQQGTITEATTVDHIISINPLNGWETENEKYPTPLNTDNCQALCFRCHASKSGKTKKKV